jgi:hypothetical protein
VCYSAAGRNLQQIDSFIENLIDSLCKVQDQNPAAVYLLGDLNDRCEYCLSNELLTWRNAGFKKGDGTINQLMFLCHQIYSNLNEGKDTAMVFLDASKAFDRIWHDGLLWKLKSIGLSEDMLQWFRSYLTNRKIRAVVEGKSSKWYNLTAGVPQGSILGPLLFLLYINDIVNNIDCEIQSGPKNGIWNLMLLNQNT